MNIVSRVKKQLIAATVGALFAVPAMAAFDFSFSNLSGAEYDTAGVYVLGDYTFTADTDDGGGLDQVEFKLWDDGVVKFSQISALAVGLTATFHFDTYYPGLVGTGAQGVGLYLYDLPDTFSASVIDPYDVPHYADPSDCTTDCGPVAAIPEPEVYAMLGMGLGFLGWAARRRKLKEAV